MMTPDETWLCQEKHHGEKTAGFFADCERLKAGEPLAYVIGWVPFLGTTIQLDSRPLIPRPETEFWVGRAIDEMPENQPLRILDLCAGSGCIGTAVLRARPDTSVDFAEINSAHHPVILENVRRNGISAPRARVLDGDLFENVSGVYDYILANPPYIDPALNRAEASVREHEPPLALYGGTRGTEFLGRILSGAPAHVAPHGVLYLEHEPEQVEEISTLAHRSGLVPETLPDQYGTLRYTRFSRVLQ